MIDSDHIYWDACVIYRHLTGDPVDLVHDIDSYLRDARDGRRKIYCSTLTYAEIRSFALGKTQYDTIIDFFADMGRAFEIVDPNPNIMIVAGNLKDEKATDPSNGSESKRVIGTGDAIHLATCLYIKNVMGIGNIVFHTFDNGKGKTWEGKCVPLLSFDLWFKKPRSALIESVCSLPRSKPEYPQHSLFAGTTDGRTLIPPARH